MIRIIIMILITIMITIIIIVIIIVIIIMIIIMIIMMKIIVKSSIVIAIVTAIMIMIKEITMLATIIKYHTMILKEKVLKIKITQKISQFLISIYQKLLTYGLYYLIQQ